MYQPMVLEQLVRQHVDQLHADAVEQRLARQCRRGRVQRHDSAPSRHVRSSVLRLWLALSRRALHRSRRDQPLVLENAPPGPMERGCNAAGERLPDTVALAADVGVRA
jgi:hypothetical protein